jgi:F1F0 ATPase subunit 2
MVTFTDIGLIRLLAALAMGIACSALYFLGLWFTIHRIRLSRWPAGLMMSSFMIRAGLLIMAIYLIMDGHVERLIACMLAFVVVRNLSARSVMGPSSRTAANEQ